MQPDDENEVEEEAEINEENVEEERSSPRPASKADLEGPLTSSSSVDEQDGDENETEARMVILDTKRPRIHFRYFLAD